MVEAKTDVKFEASEPKPEELKVQQDLTAADEAKKKKKKNKKKKKDKPETEAEGTTAAAEETKTAVQEETKEAKAEESGDEEETKDDAGKKKKKRNKKKKTGAGPSGPTTIPEGCIMGTREQDNSTLINLGSWPAGEWRQTEPPMIPMTQLYRVGEFPVGEIVEHWGDHNRHRMTSAECRAKD